jgi:hypothetical protein
MVINDAYSAVLGLIIVLPISAKRSLFKAAAFMRDF